VVDPIELRLVDVLVQLLGELARRLEVVTEGLLDDDARILGQPCVVEALDDAPEEERRDLEVEDGLLRTLDRLRDPFVRVRLAEVAVDVGEPLDEPVEDRRVELLAGRLDRRLRPVAQLVERPVVDGDADDRTVEQAAALEAVQRAERHHAREVAGDAEDDEDVGGARFVALGGRALRGLGCGGGHRSPFC
jgi:hypothetical protein